MRMTAPDPETFAQVCRVDMGTELECMDADGESATDVDESPSCTLLALTLTLLFRVRLVFSASLLKIKTAKGEAGLKRRVKMS